MALGVLLGEAQIAENADHLRALVSARYPGHNLDDLESVVVDGDFRDVLAEEGYKLLN